jgi:hypothetical protein
VATAAPGMGTAGVTDASLAGRLLLAASAISVVAFIGTPSAAAEPVATCTSDVIDGVEVDTCVGNPNANTVTGVPGVNVGFGFDFGIGIGF